MVKEESYINQVYDAAAGTYFLETLTLNIVEQAWKIFSAGKQP